MIPALGAGGPGFNSQLSPIMLRIFAADQHPFIQLRELFIESQNKLQETKQTTRKKKLLSTLRKRFGFRVLSR